MASFVGSETHCTRRDLQLLWLGKNATGLNVMRSARDKLVYSRILQDSRFCLDPWRLEV